MKLSFLSLFEFIPFLLKLLFIPIVVSLIIIKYYSTTNRKSKLIAYLLWFFGVFGILGFHRIYIGKYTTGIIWFFTGGFFGLGALYDLFSLGTQVKLYNINRSL